MSKSELDVQVGLGAEAQKGHVHGFRVALLTIVTLQPTVAAIALSSTVDARGAPKSNAPVTGPRKTGPTEM
jgi:hypothetical protein